MAHSPPGRTGEERRGEGEISKRISCWPKPQLIEYQTAALLERSDTIVFFCSLLFCLPIWIPFLDYHCLWVVVGHTTRRVCVYYFLSLFLSFIWLQCQGLCVCINLCVCFILHQCVHHIICKHRWWLIRNNFLLPIRSVYSIVYYQL